MTRNERRLSAFAERFPAVVQVLTEHGLIIGVMVPCNTSGTNSSRSEKCGTVLFNIVHRSPPSRDVFVGDGNKLTLRLAISLLRPCSPVVASSSIVYPEEENYFPVRNSNRSTSSEWSRLDGDGARSSNLLQRRISDAVRVEPRVRQ